MGIPCSKCKYRGECLLTKLPVKQRLAYCLFTPDKNESKFREFIYSLNHEDAASYASLGLRIALEKMLGIVENPLKENTSLQFKVNSNSESLPPIVQCMNSEEMIETAFDPSTNVRDSVRYQRALASAKSKGYDLNRCTFMIPFLPSSGRIQICQNQ